MVSLHGFPQTLPNMWCPSTSRMFSLFSRHFFICSHALPLYHFVLPHFSTAWAGCSFFLPVFASPLFFIQGRVFCPPCRIKSNIQYAFISLFFVSTNSENKYLSFQLLNAPQLCLHGVTNCVSLLSEQLYTSWKLRMNQCSKVVCWRLTAIKLCKAERSCRFGSIALEVHHYAWTLSHWNFVWPLLLLSAWAHGSQKCDFLSLSVPKQQRNAVVSYNPQCWLCHSNLCKWQVASCGSVPVHVRGRLAPTPSWPRVLPSARRHVILVFDHGVHTGPGSREV